mgnify:CR=1 FL=1
MQLNLLAQTALAAGLIIIMFGIGLSLTRQDFLNVFGQVIAANALGVCSISTIVGPLKVPVPFMHHNRCSAGTLDIIAVHGGIFPQ